MLASINPLGERARNNRWGLTVAAYIAGSTAGGAFSGACFGAIGHLVRAVAGDGTFSAAALVLLAVLGAVGLLVDAGVGGARLPTNHRQVNERWLDEYRGWVYGAGFGFQLGTGLVTIVTGSITYLMFAAALLTGSWAAGGLIGALFGLVRALPILAARSATGPRQLRDLIRRAQRWEAPARRLGTVVQSVVVLVAAALVVRLVVAGSQA